MSAATEVPAKKPCNRGAIFVADAVCSAGAFTGIESAPTEFARRLSSPERIASFRTAVAVLRPSASTASTDRRVIAALVAL